MSAGGLAGARTRALVLVGVVAVALGVLAWTGLDETLVYYRTPTEVVGQTGDPDERIRLGGLVVPGSVDRTDPDAVRMRLTDGTTEVAVIHDGDLPAIFDEGQGAVVEGYLGDDGTVHSDVLMVRHSNEYRPPDPESVTDADR